MATPLRLLVSGQSNAAGAASINIKAPPTLFAVMVLNAQAAGNPNWVLSIAGQLLAQGNGPQVTLGPILTSPGELLTIQVTNATPSVQIVGTLSGTQHLTPEEGAQNFQPSPNAVTLNTFQERKSLYPDGTINKRGPSFTVAAGGTATNTFTLPPGTAEIRILASAGGLLFRYSLYVGGHQTVAQYFGDPGAPGTPTAVPTPTLPFTVPVEVDWDSQVDISVLGDASQAVSFYISALFGAEAPGQAGAAQSVISPTPAPWQAGIQRAAINATSVAAAGNLVLIAASGTAVLRPTRYEFFQDGANAAGRWTLQDTTGVVVHDMFCGNVRGLLGRGNLEGIGLAAGTGLRVVNGGGVASFFGGVIDYSFTST